MANKPWIAHYPAGVPEFIEPLAFNSLVALFDHAIRRFPDHCAFDHEGVKLNYIEIDALSRRFAAYLLSLGLKKGDRVAVMLPNCLQYPICLIGILRAGLIVVNTNPLYTVRELKHQLIDSGAVALILLENFAHVFAAIQSETPVEHVIVTGLFDMCSSVKAGFAHFWMKHVKKVLPDYQIPNAVFFKKTLKLDLPLQSDPNTEGAIDDIAFLQYTGGTTGIAKGAMLTHRNILSNISQIMSWINAEKMLVPGEEVILTALPLYHIFSLTANLFVFFNLGAENVLITNPHDMKGLIHRIKGKRLTCISGVNTLYEGLMNAEGFASLDFSSLKLAIAGGMATKASTASRWKQITRKNLIEAYGLTETSPAVAINPVHSEFSGSIGLPLPSTECKIIDDAGESMPWGEIGELCVKGPQVMKGYWRSEEASAGSEWFKTGDIAYMDEGGFIYLKDRKKDMILVSGFNVYPAEIEEVVCRHPDIKECAAIGVADDKTGEAIWLYVVSRNPNLDKAGIIAHCRQHLTAYKVPKHVEFLASLPKSSLGKVLRRALLESGK